MKMIKNFFRTGLSLDLKPQTHTRKINPKLGLLGFFGFLGFSGFLVFLPEFANNTQLPFPFLFFSFFGFFSFYYEGKMSNTLMDERYRSNTFRASSIANKSALMLIILVTIFSLNIFKIENNDILVSFLLATIGLAFGMAIFLSMYLLYKFDSAEE